MTKTVSTSALKTHCSSIIDNVRRDREPVLVTKRGRPVAKIIPLQPETSDSLFGFAKGNVTIVGDIIEPIDVEWEAAT